jgi:hypothetical protein
MPKAKSFYSNVGIGEATTFLKFRLLKLDNS